MDGFELQVSGSLVVSGTSAAPVVFTSYHDDSFGGDYGWDVDDAVTERQYWDCGVVAGGVADLSYTHLRYSNTGLRRRSRVGRSALDHVTMDNVNLVSLTTTVDR